MIVEGEKKPFAGRETFFLVSVLMRIFLLIQFDFKKKKKKLNSKESQSICE